MAAMTDPPFTGFSKRYYESHTQVYQQDIMNDFKRLVVQLADALDDEDSKGKIRYLHKDKFGPGGEPMKALDMFDRLEEKGVFSARNVQPLETLLKNSDRCDLINTHLDPYRRRHSCQLSQSAPLQHSVSSPETSTLPTHHHGTPHRSISFPTASTMPTSIPLQQSRDITSIQEEHQTAEEQHAPTTYESQKSLLVSGTFTSEIMSSLKMSGIGTSSYQSQSRHREEGAAIGHSRECTEQFTSSSHPVPSCLRQGRELLHEHKRDSEPSVQASNKAVSFEVGGDIRAPSTLPHDVDSQLNFPMDTIPPSPTEVRSKQTNLTNQADSLTSALTKSLQQADEWSRSNTPLPIPVEKTPVEVTDRQATDEAVVHVATQSKPHPQQNPTHLPTVPETGRENDPIPLSPLPDCAAATASVECSNVPRTWRSKPQTFILKREKMAIMISKQKTSHYHKRFSTTIPISKTKKGSIQLTLEIFPYGRDGDAVSHHATVLVRISYSLTSCKCQEITENCKCTVGVKLTFVNSKTQEVLSTKEGKTELNPNSSEGCIHIGQALSHSDILYSKTKEIQVQVEAELHCRDKVIAVQSTDPDCLDYMLITTNHTASEC